MRQIAIYSKIPSLIGDNSLRIFGFIWAGEQTLSESKFSPTLWPPLWSIKSRKQREFWTKKKKGGLLVKLKQDIIPLRPLGAVLVIHANVDTESVSNIK